MQYNTHTQGIHNGTIFVFLFPNPRPPQWDEVSIRSLSLCCDLLTSVCRAALQFCDDALDCHLQVIIGTLTAQVTSQPAISQQVRHIADILKGQINLIDRIRDTVHRKVKTWTGCPPQDVIFDNLYSLSPQCGIQ